jgi:hypothetical protein
MTAQTEQAKALKYLEEAEKLYSEATRISPSTQIEDRLTELRRLKFWIRRMTALKL